MKSSSEPPLCPADSPSVPWSCAHPARSEALSSSQGCVGVDQGYKGRGFVAKSWAGFSEHREEQTAERMEVRKEKSLVLMNTNEDKAALTFLAPFHTKLKSQRMSSASSKEARSSSSHVRRGMFGSSLDPSICTRECSHNSILLSCSHSISNSLL